MAENSRPVAARLHSKPVVIGIVVAGLACGGGAALWLRSLAPVRTNATIAEITDDRRAAILSGAESLVAQGELQKAHAVLDAAATEFPTDRPLRIALGDSLLLLRRAPEAYEQYDRALTIGPRDAKTEFTAGTIANMCGKLDLAVQHYQSAQREDPTNPDAPLYLAQVQMKLGQRDQAKANLLLAAKLSPERAIVWASLAEAMLDDNKVDLALQHIRTARKLEPAVMAWRLIEARALKRSNDPAGALSVLITGTEEPTEPAVLSLAGECAAMLGRAEDAGKYFSRASDVSPADRDLARAAAEWLEKAGDSSRAATYRERAGK